MRRDGDCNTQQRTHGKPTAMPKKADAKHFSANDSCGPLRTSVCACQCSHSRDLYVHVEHAHTDMRDAEIKQTIHSTTRCRRMQSPCADVHADMDTNTQIYRIRAAYTKHTRMHVHLDFGLLVLLEFRKALTSGRLFSLETFRLAFCDRRGGRGGLLKIFHVLVFFEVLHAESQPPSLQRTLPLFAQ